MRWFDKRYRSLNFELREIFNEKIFKLSLDGGFTCPNRDGKIGFNGCIFCSDSGSGEYASNRVLTIDQQVKDQISLLSNKWPNGKYIAYFQNFTNTYADINALREKYEAAINCDDIVGIAIATRPDCLDDDVIQLLSELSKKTYLWIELGLQTIHDESAKFLRRGYLFSLFEEKVKKLRSYNINIVTHLILGIPNETREMIFESISKISNMDIQGVKLHLLHIIKGTDLEKYYNSTKFTLLEKEEYIHLICDILERLNPNITIHRLTGDGSKDTLLEPWWSLDKRSILNGIDKELSIRDSFQGKYYLSKM
ncbi:TIGR01212 family radical SAM protein [Tepidibacter hydrothermalis]|uniref:TIGR01212 family radical SAM protein n=1 Tax=Tepidibacter hydrothermalis TaxID=3036126 RepID=A0ABY8EGA2_9FIRM|nr:TIGR01212 family radical SAM protein [Tepidibacter hydrothermalis]WFD11958.1 TIGR01212 family radical SAM protein [Tepidibacter hydrothermalis]